ncbi:MAG: DUF5666 domain-containing protein [Acidimicrobiales bacterium]
MDLESLPPDPADPWTQPPPPPQVAPPAARARWSTRARIAASVSAVGLAGAGAFGVAQLTSSSGIRLGALAAATSPTSTAPHKVHRGAAFGQVSNVSGPSFTVSASRNATTRTTNVVTDASTTFTKTIKGAVGDVKVGNLIAVAGTRGTDGVLNATRIVIAPAGMTGKGGAGGPEGMGGGPGHGAKSRQADGAEPGEAAEPGNATPPTTTPADRPRFVVGTVQSITNGVITVQDRRGGTDTVSTSSTTTVIETVAAALSDVTNGATVAVVGTPTADGTHLTATRVDVIDPSLVGQGGFGVGNFGPGRGGHR